MNKETKSELKKYKNWLNDNHKGMYVKISDYSLNKYIKEQLTIPVVMDSLNFGFCKYPKDVCDRQCQDCKAEEMWGNKNLY